MGSFKALGSAFLVGASLLPTTRSIQKAIADPPAFNAVTDELVHLVG